MSRHHKVHQQNEAIHSLQQNQLETLLKKQNDKINFISVLRAFRKWAHEYPLLLKCTEMYRQLKERTSLLENVRSSYLKDVISVKMQLEQVEKIAKKDPVIRADRNNSDLNEALYELHTLPSVDLKKIIEKAKTYMSQTSVQFKSNLYDTGLVDPSTCKTLNEWEKSRAYRRKLRQEKSPAYTYPEAGGESIQLNVPCGFKLFVRYCSDCIGIVNLVKNWNEEIESAIRFKTDFAEVDKKIEGFKQAIENLHSMVIQKETRIAELENILANTQGSSAWIKNNIFSSSNKESYLEEKIRKLSNCLQMAEADREGLALRYQGKLLAQEQTIHNIKLNVHKQLNNEKVEKNLESQARLNLNQSLMAIKKEKLMLENDIDALYNEKTLILAELTDEKKKIEYLTQLHESLEQLLNEKDTKIHQLKVESNERYSLLEEKLQQIQREYDNLEKEQETFRDEIRAKKLLVIKYANEMNDMKEKIQVLDTENKELKVQVQIRPQLKLKKLRIVTWAVICILRFAKFMKSKDFKLLGCVGFKALCEKKEAECRLLEKSSLLLQEELSKSAAQIDQITQEREVKDIRIKHLNNVLNEKSQEITMLQDNFLRKDQEYKVELSKNESLVREYQQMSMVINSFTDNQSFIMSFEQLQSLIHRHNIHSKSQKFIIENFCRHYYQNHLQVLLLDLDNNSEEWKRKYELIMNNHVSLEATAVNTQNIMESNTNYIVPNSARGDNNSIISNNSNPSVDISASININNTSFLHSNPLTLPNIGQIFAAFNLNFYQRKSKQYYMNILRNKFQRMTKWIQSNRHRYFLYKNNEFSLPENTNISSSMVIDMGLTFYSNNSTTNSMLISSNQMTAMFDRKTYHWDEFISDYKLSHTIVEASGIVSKNKEEKKEENEEKEQEDIKVSSKRIPVTREVLGNYDKTIKQAITVSLQNDYDKVFTILKNHHKDQESLDNYIRELHTYLMQYQQLLIVYQNALPNYFIVLQKFKELSKQFRQLQKQNNKFTKANDTYKNAKQQRRQMQSMKTSFSHLLNDKRDVSVYLNNVIDAINTVKEDYGHLYSPKAEQKESNDPEKRSKLKASVYSNSLPQIHSPRPSSEINLESVTSPHNIESAKRSPMNSMMINPPPFEPPAPMLKESDNNSPEERINTSIKDLNILLNDTIESDLDDDLDDEEDGGDIEGDNLQEELEISRKEAEQLLKYDTGMKQEIQNLQSENQRLKESLAKVTEEQNQQADVLKTLSNRWEELSKEFYYVKNMNDQLNHENDLMKEIIYDDYRFHNQKLEFTVKSLQDNQKPIQRRNSSYSYDSSYKGSSDNQVPSYQDSENPTSYNKIPVVNNFNNKSFRGVDKQDINLMVGEVHTDLTKALGNRATIYKPKVELSQSLAMTLGDSVDDDKKMESNYEVLASHYENNEEDQQSSDEPFVDRIMNSLPRSSSAKTMKVGKLDINFDPFSRPQSAKSRPLSPTNRPISPKQEVITLDEYQLKQLEKSRNAFNFAKSLLRKGSKNELEASARPQSANALGKSSTPLKLNRPLSGTGTYESKFSKLKQMPFSKIDNGQVDLYLEEEDDDESQLVARHRPTREERLSITNTAAYLQANVVKPRHMAHSQSQSILLGPDNSNGPQRSNSTNNIPIQKFDSPLKSLANKVPPNSNVKGDYAKYFPPKPKPSNIASSNIITYDDETI